MAAQASGATTGAAAASAAAADAPRPTGRSRTASGLALALVSAVFFGTSGTLVRGMLDTGWSPGAATLVRVSIAAVAVAPFGIAALHGDWSLLRRNARLIALYGAFGVTGAQFFYFSAVQYLQVGTALLIEYLAPIAVVGWLWARHGQRPGRLTFVGAGLAILGLVLVLDLLSGGVGVHPLGVTFALLAMVGCAAYFVVSADEGNGLPPVTLAAAGLATSAVLMGVLGLVGALPLTFSGADAVYGERTLPVLVPVLWLGLVSAAAAYTAGIAAARRLGSRLVSFVALTEVLAAILAAWAVLGEAPNGVQLAGSALVVVGVVVVKLGEREPAVTEGSGEPLPEVDADPEGMTVDAVAAEPEVVAVATVAAVAAVAD